jgi:hypothetical protein
MAALQQVGVLGEVIETKAGLVVWPARMDAEGMRRLDEGTTWPFLISWLVDVVVVCGMAAYEIANVGCES